MTAKPLLLIDVDGVLNPFAAKRCPAGFTESLIAGYKVRLRASDGPSLLAFADRYELVWATTWEDEANTEIGPRLGLPHLPVVHFDFGETRGDKHPAIAAFAGGRPILWLEDEPWFTERDWARKRSRTIPTRIVSVNPGRGIIAEQYSIISRFVAELDR